MDFAVNHNLMAANTARNLNAHHGKLLASCERLSSGLRINSSADDAAGLAIRELLRADVAAINQGVRNANDAISMLQVADGALSIIDEKLIRMKELAEQAATGTYASDQRLMINSEFQAMAREIDRIARATDFNGQRLLDGRLSGRHEGSGLDARGAMKIHFGTGNDSAEDYYYVEIGDCTTRGLGLRTPADGEGDSGTNTNALMFNDMEPGVPEVRMPAGLGNMQDIFPVQGEWYIGYDENGHETNNFMFKIPAGTKNIVINATGAGIIPRPNSYPDNDIQLYTVAGIHLAGTPQDDYVWHNDRFPNQSFPDYVNVPTSVTDNQGRLPFASTNESLLNSGPGSYDASMSLKITEYNGMKIGYSGDADRFDASPNDGVTDTWPDYELLTISEAKEDLVVWLPGYMSGMMKVWWDVDQEQFDMANGATPAAEAEAGLIAIETQEKAQKALTRIDNAIVSKDMIRARLGSLQNRLENTVSNLTIKSENLQATESRISDADVAIEMTRFVRNQILTQSAVAMLGQANTLPHMAMQLMG